MKAATLGAKRKAGQCMISIHAAREGGDHVNKSPLVNAGISIHAAREGGDVKICRNTVRNGISIHAAREGGDCGNE